MRTGAWGVLVARATMVLAAAGGGQNPGGPLAAPMACWPGELPGYVAGCLLTPAKGKGPAYLGACRATTPRWGEGPVRGERIWGGSDDPDLPFPFRVA